MKYKNSYVTLDARLYHRQHPTPLDNPQAGHFNPIVAKQIGWDTDNELMDNWVDILGGHYVPKGFDPLAMAYAGHQFGQWAGQLGDGRGLLMAQVLDSNNVLTDLHLKGIGLTPYSRMGDGRAVLRSTIREYLCGHALSSLGIKSSNALGFVTSTTKVRRETMESGAALMRVADSHIRLGHIEWVANFAPDLLHSFTHYMIDTYYPHLKTSQTPILDFISEVVKHTAIMIANWQLIGFAHGVMNTDNLSITGSTIDFGPFGFLERFNPAWINNHSDYTGRYTYQNQPAIGHWNLNVWAMNFMRLAKQETNEKNDTVTAISKETIGKRLADYEPLFMRHYQQGMCKKLGLPMSSLLCSQLYKSNLYEFNVSSSDQKKQNDQNDVQINDLNTINNTLKLAFDFLDIIETNKLDYTNSFRSLIAIVNKQDEATQHTASYETQLLDSIHSELNAKELERFKLWQSDYLAHIDAQISMGTVKSRQDVVKTLETANPVYVLRNAMAQRAIEKANDNDFSEVDRLFKLLRTPFETNVMATMADTTPPDRDDTPIAVSCSS